MPAVSWWDADWYKGSARNRAAWLKELDNTAHIRTREDLLVVSETKECFKRLHGSVLGPVLSSSISIQPSLPWAIVKLLFPNTIKKSVWEWTVQIGTYRQNIWLCLLSHDLKKKQHRRGILLWDEHLHTGLSRLLLRTSCFRVYFTRTIDYRHIFFHL